VLVLFALTRAPISLVATQPSVLVVHPAVPMKSTPIGSASGA